MILCNKIGIYWHLFMKQFIYKKKSSYTGLYRKRRQHVEGDTVCSAIW